MQAAPFSVSDVEIALVAEHDYAYVVIAVDNDEFGAFETTITAPVIVNVPELRRRHPRYRSATPLTSARVSVRQE